MRTILPEHQNPTLREIAHDVALDDIGSDRVKKLVREMKALLSNEEYGVALAAPQGGERLRLFIVSGRALARDARNTPDEQKDDEVSPHREEAPAVADQVYINPVMSKMSRVRKGKHEGCLSIRGKWGMVSRAEKATVRAYDEAGQLFTRGASGFLAHVFQHEMDHLDGILYTDKATKIYDEKTDSAR